MNLVYGFKDTINILAFRFNMIKTTKGKIMLGIVFAIVALLIFGTTSIGSTIRLLANNSIAQVSPAVRDLAVQYVRSFVQDGANFAITGVLAALIGSVLLIPLVGFTFSTLIPSGDLVSVRRNDYHKLSDSIILQILSSISIIQLFILTALNSLLTIQSTRPGVGIVFGWVVWLLMILLTTTAAWTFEWMGRKLGVRKKYTILVAVGIAIAVVALIFRKQSGNLFGLSPLYGEVVKNLDSYNAGQVAAVFGVMAALFAGAWFFLSFIGSRALNLPERPKRKKAYRKAWNMSLGRKKSNLTQYRFLLSIILNNINIWKPLLLATGFAFFSILIFQGSLQILMSLLFVIPLIVSMSWGVNTFGILGGGMTWLTSLPQGKEKLLPSILLVQLTLVGTLLTVVYLPLIILFHTPVHDLLSFLLSSLTATVIMTRSALSKTVHQPERYRVHIKGENVLPPAKALNYLARFALGAGTFGIVVFILDNNLYQFGIFVVVFIYQAYRYHRLNKNWLSKPEVIENIIRSVGY